MNIFLGVSAALGGVVAFCSGIVVIARAIFSQSTATKENTIAINALTSTVNNMERNFGDRLTRLETKQ